MRNRSRRPGRPPVLCLALLLAPVCALGAQDPPLPPSGRPPEMMERRVEPPAPPAPPTAGQLLSQLGLTPADVARRKASGERPLPASTPGPENDLVRGRGAAPPAAVRSPTLPEVLEAMRREPGGPEMLERARRGGARIPPDPGRDDADAVGGVGGLGGRGKGDAAALHPEVRVQFPTLTATRRQWANVAGLGTLSAQGHLPLFTSETPQMGPFLRYALNSYFGPVDVRPAVAIGLNVATDGYYLISVFATAAKASLRLGAGASPYRAVAGGEWDHTLLLGGTSTYSSYPVVVNLKANSPYNFYWTIDANVNSSAYVWVSEVSVYKL